jgi:hypothetical protein
MSAWVMTASAVGGCLWRAAALIGPSGGSSTDVGGVPGYRPRPWLSAELSASAGSSVSREPRH